jgi:hypothetical protein
VIHNGPIPFFVHGALDYLLGALLIVSSFLLGFDSGAATAVSIIAGVGVLALAASTDGPTSVTSAIPVSVHILLDVGAAVLFIAAPFLFGFSDESAPTAFFLGLGVVEILLVIATRFPAQERRMRTEPAAEPEPEPELAGERPVDPDA